MDQFSNDHREGSAQCETPIYKSIVFYYDSKTGEPPTVVIPHPDSSPPFSLTKLTWYDEQGVNIRSHHVILRAFEVSIVTAPLHDTRSVVNDTGQGSASDPRSAAILTLLIAKDPLTCSNILLSIGVHLAFTLLTLKPHSIITEIVIPT